MNAAGTHPPTAGAPSRDDTASRWRLPVLALLLLTGAILLSPFRDFQEAFGQGDNGRDLYAFEQTLHGKLPYRDYWWTYGPLMPLVYPVFYLLFGCQISSILIGALFFRLLAAGFLYLAISELCGVGCAFVAAVWFLVFQNDFFYTYNHIAGVAAIAAVLWCALAYVRNRKISFGFGGLVAIFILALIKVNFAVVALGVCVLAVFLADHFSRAAKTQGLAWFYASAFGAVPLAVTAVYVFFLQGFSFHDAAQCLPYVGAHQAQTIPFADMLERYVAIAWTTFHQDEIALVFGVLCGVAAVSTTVALWARKLESLRRTRLILTLAILFVFYLGNCHEFILRGVWYCLWWTQPITMALSFVLLGTAAESLRKPVRIALWTTIAVMSMFGWLQKVQTAARCRTPDRFLSSDRARIHVGNDPDWVRTVNQVTGHLQQTLKPGELFLAAPYDCLYYFLTARETPTRLILLAENMDITPSQQHAMIADLEQKRVNQVLLSNRSSSTEFGTGMFGVTYCDVLARYLQANFEEAARFGNWNAEPGWGWNHAVKILKRKATGATDGASRTGR